MNAAHPARVPSHDFCFVHAADLHLGGRRWVENEPTNPGLAAQIRLADHLALVGLVDLCLREQARILVCAGDIIDGWCRNYLAALRLVEELRRLVAGGCRVAFILGNHDVRSRMVSSLLLPKGAEVLGRHGPETRILEELGLALHGWSAPEVARGVDVAALYPPPVSGLVNVGLLHTSAEGRSGHADYAPCSRRTLRQHGYDYWALGHVHAREVIASDPLIIFPGNLQARGHREPGPKGATLVRVGDGKIATAEHRAVDAVRFETLIVDAPDVIHFENLLDTVHNALELLTEHCPDRPLVARLVVRGIGAASAASTVAPEQRRRELSELARRAGNESLWVDEIAIESGVDFGAWPDRLVA